MKNFILKEINADSEIRSCYTILHGLRPHLTNEEAFVRQIKRQLSEGYKLLCSEENGEIKAVAGFRFFECLAWGKVLYIDDLVTAPETRKSGHGGALLKHLIEIAKKEHCNQVHLDSGPQRHDAHRLYLNSGFKIIAHHFGSETNSDIP